MKIDKNKVKRVSKALLLICIVNIVSFAAFCVGHTIYEFKLESNLGTCIKLILGGGMIFASILGWTLWIFEIFHDLINDQVWKRK